MQAKAKRAPTYRFYAFSDKVYRFDVLKHALALCRENDDAPGVNGQVFADIEKHGKKWLGELAEELWNKTYSPQPVRRIEAVCRTKQRTSSSRVKPKCLTR